MVYTAIDDPSAFFTTAIYTGTGSSRNVTNSALEDMQPDLVWIKSRSAGDQEHNLYDSTRGTGKRIQSNSTEAGSDRDGVTAFNSDGFTTDYSDANTDSSTYVAWQWACNGGTTSSNTSGDIESTVQANTTSGFSIVKYRGSGTDNDSIGHSLGVAPEMIILKKYSASDPWMVFHHKLTAGTELVLNTTAGEVDDAYNGTWGDNHPGNISSTVFEIGYGGDSNSSGDDYIAYCFTSIQGYSKLGIYTGTGDADGPFIYTGFKPAWLLIKETTSGNTNDWNIYDSKRSAYNSMDDILEANLADAEGTGRADVDFLSNGFKQRNTHADSNRDAGTFVYMAFAEQPFVTSGGVPCTAK